MTGWISPLPLGPTAWNVGQTDLPVHAARKLLGDRAIIGVSTDSIEQARQAERDGADYVGFGPVFPTLTKLDAGPVSGLEALGVVCAESSVPVVAIGGIDIGNIASVARRGPACVSVVSAVARAGDMRKATADLIREFQSVRFQG